MRTGLPFLIACLGCLAFGFEALAASSVNQTSPNGRIAALMHQGISECQRKQYDRAISTFSTALQMHPDAKQAAQIHERRARAYNERDEFKKAIDDATEAIRLNPNLSEFYITRGIAYRRSGDSDRAITDYSMAIKVDPKFDRP